MSIKKQSGISTNTLKDVVRKDKNILLVFPKRKILLSTEDYLSGYFYPGKEFSDSEISTLKEKSSLCKAEGYLHSLLRNHRYTIKETTDKLKIKYALSEDKIHFLLSLYIEDKILDDESYAFDFYESRREQGYGENAIFAKLKRKGIPEEIIQKLRTQEEASSPSRDKILSLLERKDKPNLRKPIQKRKESLFAFLLRRGFNPSDAEKFIEDYFEALPRTKDEQTEQRKAEYLKKEGEKCYNAVRKKNLSSFQRKSKFLSSRREKGFLKEDIDSFLSQRGYTFHD